MEYKSLPKRLKISTIQNVSANRLSLIAVATCDRRFCWLSLRQTHACAGPRTTLGDDGRAGLWIRRRAPERLTDHGGPIPFGRCEKAYPPHAMMNS
jgi:hypothetical protein